MILLSDDLHLKAEVPRNCSIILNCTRVIHVEIVVIEIRMYVLMPSNLRQIAGNCPRPCVLGTTLSTEAWVAIGKKETAG